MGKLGELYNQIGQKVDNNLIVTTGRRRQHPLTTQDYQDPDTLEQKRKQYLLHTASFGNQQIAIVDKTSPHSVTDLMVTARAENRVMSFGDLNPEASRYMLANLHDFAAYTSDRQIIDRFGLNGGFLRIAANIDPYTEDRGSIQGERTLHVHCEAFPQLGTSKEQQLDFTNPRDTAVLKIVDPLSLLGPQIMDELIFNAGAPYHRESLTEMFEAIPFDPMRLRRNKMLVASNLRLRDSWNTLKNEDFGNVLKDMEVAINQTYNYVSRLFTGADANFSVHEWGRSALLDEGAIHQNIEREERLSDASKGQLHLLASSLKTVPPDVMEWLKAKRKTSTAFGYPERILGFAGPAYTMTFYTPGTIEELRDGFTDANAFLAIEPVIRRASGSGGLTIDSEGKTLKVDKGSAAPFFTEEELVKRTEFQQEFLQRYIQPISK